MTLLDAKEIILTRLAVTEGAYSMHPDLALYYDLSVFLDISPNRQQDRILLRNTPEKANRFFKEWIPLEQKYFSAFSVAKRCTTQIKI